MQLIILSAVKHCSLKGCGVLEYLRAGFELLSLMKCCRLRGSWFEFDLGEYEWNNVDRCAVA